MPRLEFEMEWQEAEHVRGEELTATWACLTIRLGDRSISRVFDKRAKTVRDGIFIPVYPLAEWLVENWWSLLYEFENPLKRHDADFIWRHSTAYARQGYALPGLEIISSESRTKLRWAPDLLKWSGIEFIGPGGEEWIDKESFRDACEQLVSAVVRRLATIGVEGTRLQRDWAVIQATDTEEEEFCRVAGGIGWDPYALSEKERDLVQKIDRELTHDVLEQAVPILDPAKLDADIEAIVRGLRVGREARVPLLEFRKMRGVIVGIAGNEPYATPWKVGYDLAHEARRHLGLNGQALPSFEAIGRAIAESPAVLEAATRPVDFGAAALVDGLVAQAESDDPGFAFQDRHDESLRFHFCRALAEVLMHPGQDSLITRAKSDRQRLSRAFAAEFLAPADALRERIRTSEIGEDDVARLTKEFGVSSFVIQHQLENHQIAKFPQSWQDA